MITNSFLLFLLSFSFSVTIISFKIASLYVTWHNFLYFSKSIVLFCPLHVFIFLYIYIYLSLFLSLTLTLFLCIVFQPLASSSLKSGLGRTKVDSGVKEWKPLILRIKRIRPVLLTFLRARTLSTIYLSTKARAISH